MELPCGRDMFCLWFVVAASVAVANDRQYHSYETFVSDLIALRHDWVVIEPVGRSVQDRTIHAVRIANPSSNSARRAVLIVCGQHPRELIVVEACLFLVETIIERLGEGCATSLGRRMLFILQHIDLHVIPLLNPDGRVRLEHDADSCWRGNGRKVDLNRNFRWQFGRPGSSGSNQSEEYRGPYAHSEPETRVVEELVTSRDYLAAFDVHSGEQQLLSPFVDTESKEAKRKSANSEMELAIISEVLAHSQYIRRGGIAYLENTYAADGTMMDFLSGVMKIPYSFVIESFGDPTETLDPDVDCFRQFNPPGYRLYTILRRIMTVFDLALTKLIKLEFGAEVELIEIRPETPTARARQNWFRDACLVHLKAIVTHAQY